MAARKGMSWLLAAAAASTILAGCGSSEESAAPTTSAPAPGPGFRSGDCNGITDADITRRGRGGDVHQGRRQRRRLLLAGEFHVRHRRRSAWGSRRGGTAEAIWTPSGSWNRTPAASSPSCRWTATKGFKAYDGNACSFYVAKGGDVITWSIQTLNPATLPDLCTITEQLAQLSQERVN